MMKRRPRFWYCFACKVRVASWFARGFHQKPTCNVHIAVMSEELTITLAAGELNAVQRINDRRKG